MITYNNNMINSDISIQRRLSYVISVRYICLPQWGGSRAKPGPPGHSGQPQGTKTPMRGLWFRV